MSRRERWRFLGLPKDAGVLDPLTDTAELKPAAAGGSAASGAHLSQEDLQGYADGRLAPARMNSCGVHLEVCEACRAELEDLRAFRSESAGLSRAGQLRPASSGRKPRRKVSTTLAVLIAVACVAIIGGWLGWLRNKSAPPSTSPRAAPSIAVSPAMPAKVTSTLPAVGTPPPQVPSTQDSAKPDPSKQDPSKQVASTQDLSTQNLSFALVSPVGESTSDTRPEFRWQPLAGAIGYSVVIVDSGLHRVQRSPGIRSTHWRPRRPLRRGQTYLWQVTATLRGGAKVVATALATPAQVRIIDATGAGHRER